MSQEKEFPGCGGDLESTSPFCATGAGQFEERKATLAGTVPPLACHALQGFCAKGVLPSSSARHLRGASQLLYLLFLEGLRVCGALRGASRVALAAARALALEARVT